MFDKKKESEIVKLMFALQLTRKEAIEVLAFDTGKGDNEEVKKIEQKEKEQEKDKKPKKGSSLDKVKHQKAKKKVDENKEIIMKRIKVITDDQQIFFKPKLVTPSKVTFMDKDGNYYSLSLTKHKSAPDGYLEE